MNENCAPGDDLPDGRGARPLAARIGAAIPIANPGEAAGDLPARIPGAGFAALDPAFAPGSGRTPVGALPGLTPAMPCLGAVRTVAGAPRLAPAAASAPAAAGTIATGVGSRVFRRAGVDPALGSGPVATVMQDVPSLAACPGLVGLLPT